MYIHFVTVERLWRLGRTHGAPYRGYEYVPLRFGGGGDVVRRMGTQQMRDCDCLLLSTELLLCEKRVDDGQ